MVYLYDQLVSRGYVAHPEGMVPDTQAEFIRRITEGFAPLGASFDGASDINPVAETSTTNTATAGYHEQNSPTTPIPLPRRVITGSVTDPAMLAKFSEEFDARRAGDVLPPSLEKGPERLKQLAAMRDVFLQMGHDLGLDLSKRLTPDDMIHFFGPDAMDQIRRTFNTPATWNGGRLDSREIIAAEHYEMGDTLDLVNHEMTHNLAYAAVRLQQTSNREVEVQSTSYGLTSRHPGAGKGPFNILDEIATEALSRHIKATYWPSHPILGNYSEEGDGYSSDMDLGKALVARVAEVTGGTEESVWKTIWRSLLTGEKKDTMHLIRETFGSKGLRVLAEYRETNEDAWNKVLEELDLYVD